MVIALVGNQNCGKTTIFNQVTDMKQHVGNFPGVTVETTYGKVPNVVDCELVDLPGLYSLNTYTSEEKVTKEFLYKVKPDILINVVDATNLQRNLYLTMQLKELNIPMVMALNMLDEVEKNNGKIITKKLSERLEIPIIEMKSVTKDETQRLIDKAIQTKKIAKLSEIKEYKKEDVEEQYKKIEEICKNVIEMPENREKIRSYKIDKILTNKFLGIPIFFLIMYAIFNLTFNVIGKYFSELLNKGIEIISIQITNFFEYNNYNYILEKLIVDGVLNGIGSVLSFLPIIVTLYFFLSILEDSGYMTRIAFMMDKPLRKIGVSGKSIVPILLGFGCSVPAILSIRTIQSEKEKKLSLLLVPFISCSAKIPIYAIFCSTFFKENPALAMIAIYSLGIILGISVTAVINNKINQKLDETFIMELPNYRIPSLKNTWHLMWNKSKDFLAKSFSIIFVASIIIWFLKTFDNNLIVVKEENSMLALLGQKISFIFRPLGLDNWKITTSLITGLIAKEAILSTFSILSSEVGNAITEIFSGATAISFLIFVLLYPPCIATIGVVKKEFGKKEAIKMIINQFFIAYITAFLFYQIIFPFLSL